MDNADGTVSITPNTAAIDAGRGFWNRATGCTSDSTPACCQRLDAIYTDGSEAVAEMWAYGDDPAFTVVPTADETAFNSFSLFGGAAATLAPDDYSSIPITTPNTNDAVCLDAAVDSGLSAYSPFPNDASCTHVGDCVSAPSTCTAACELAADRTVVVTTPPSFGGAVCPTSVTTDCTFGDGLCVAAAPPSGAVAVQITLDTNLASCCADAASEAAFDTSFKIDVASATTVLPSQVVITGKVDGSLVVSFSILPAPDGTVATLTAINGALADATIAGSSTVTPATPTVVAPVVVPAATESDEWEWWNYLLLFIFIGAVAAMIAFAVKSQQATKGESKQTESDNPVFADSQAFDREI